MIEDGFLSEKLRLRAYGVWVVKLLSNMTLRLFYELSKNNYSNYSGRSAGTLLAEVWSLKVREANVLVRGWTRSLQPFSK